MSADLFDITERRKAVTALPAARSDFGCTRAGSIDEQALRSSPDWSLYALDPGTREAVFVELPAGTDLAQAGFAYVAQYQKALRLALLPFERFVAASRALDAPAQLAFLFSTGRCGSTLASRMLARLPGVWSLSEPDAYTVLATARHALADEAMVDLVRASTLWTVRPPRGQCVQTVVIKPRSEATLIASACQRAFSASRSVFLYRDLVGYADSVYRFGQRVLGPDAYVGGGEGWRPLWDFLMVGTPLRQLEDWFAPDHGPIGWEEFHTLLWVLRIDGYLQALRRGMRFTAIHYDDLDRDREAQTRRLLAGCGIDPAQLALAMAAFDHDSHHGSAGANSVPARAMTDAQATRARALLARLGRRDYIVSRLPDSTAG